MPLASAAWGLNPVDLKHKVNINVENVIGRISGIAPQFFAEAVKVLFPYICFPLHVCLVFHQTYRVLWCIQDENIMEPPRSVQRGVSELVDAALLPRNLCMMDPTWHPWF